MKNLIHPFIIVFYLFIALPVSSQIGVGGIPPGIEHKLFLRSSVQKHITPVDFDVEMLKSEDRADARAGYPLRIAKIIPMELDLIRDGEWISLPGGQKICQLNISAPEALAVILYYNKFFLPEGARLFIYNTRGKQILGAYTSTTNAAGKEFATEAVSGDELVLEYIPPVVSSVEQQEPEILISGVGYCYNHIYSDDQMQLRMNESGSCEVNINCPEGAEWQHQKKGVVKTVTPIGSNSYLCSGSIVNNTSGALIPYYLSAHHCFYDDFQNRAVFNRMIFYFHYEHPGCSNPDEEPKTTVTMVGAECLVDIGIEGGSDGALLRLNDDIPLEYDVFYNGWNAEETPPSSGVGIHHPRGDVKKISTYTQPALSGQWWDGEFRGAKNAHWEVTFSATENGHGVTEGGSSGSPLFDANGYIVGTLTGGNSSCSNRTGSNLYGKLQHHWDKYTQQMKTYLDPGETGTKVLPGRYSDVQAKANFKTDVSSIYVNDSVKFTNLSLGAFNSYWEFPGGTPSMSTAKHPVVKYETAGSYEVFLTINKEMESEQIYPETVLITVEERPGSVIAGSLTARVNENKNAVDLSWEGHGKGLSSELERTEKEQVMRWDDALFSASTRIAKEGTYDILSRWTPEDLNKYQQIDLTGIYVSVDNLNSTYFLKVIQDGETLYRGEMKGFARKTDNYFRLPQSIKIDLTKDLYAGYEVTHKTGAIPVAYDKGPVRKNRNFVRFGNALYKAEDYSIQGNWNIGIQVNSIKKPEYIYDIYRDNQLIASGLQKNAFSEKISDWSTFPHCYCITTRFRDVPFLPGSEQVCVEAPDISSHLSFVRINPSSGEVQIFSKSPIREIIVRDAGGRFIYSYNPGEVISAFIPSKNWNKGVYLIQLVTDDGNECFKIVK